MIRTNALLARRGNISRARKKACKGFYRVNGVTVMCWPLVIEDERWVGNKSSTYGKREAALEPSQRVEQVIQGVIIRLTRFSAEKTKTCEKRHFLTRVLWLKTLPSYTNKRRFSITSSFE